MKLSAFITGIAGQDGAYLAKHLVKLGYRVTGLSLESNAKHLWRLKYLGLDSKVKIIKGNQENAPDLNQIIKKGQFTEIYNLAGQSSVARSWEHPAETFNANLLGTLNLLDALLKHSPRSRLFNASSAEIYGEANGVINEKTNRYTPSNPYGASKLAAHLLVQSYRSRYEMHLSNGILFTHSSPLQADFFVLKQIASGVAKIAAGQAKKLHLGNLDVNRDWSYAPDVVAAMHKILKAKDPADYVICSGQIRSIKQLAHFALRQIGVEDPAKFISVDKNRQRRKDVKNMRGSAARLKKLGWRAATTPEQMIKLMLDFEITKI